MSSLPPEDERESDLLSDEPTIELVVRAQSGDRLAVEALLQRSIPQLKRWAHGKLPPAARNNLDTGDLVQETVLHVLRRIPAGRVVTYGDVARLAGRPGAARAVGQIMRLANEPGLPYHRVIAAGGRLGGFGRDPQMKADRLTAEGHTVRRGRVLDFPARRWNGR